MPIYLIIAYVCRKLKHSNNCANIGLTLYVWYKVSIKYYLIDITMLL